MEKRILAFKLQSLNESEETYLLQQYDFHERHRPESESRKYLLLVSVFDKDGAVAEKIGKWSEIKAVEDIGSVIHSLPRPGTNISEVSEQLHALADTLPALGSLNEVVWFTDEENCPNVKDDVELYGALKRLVQWHNTTLRLVDLTREEKHSHFNKTQAPKMFQWVEYMNADIVTDYRFGEPEMWHGSIVINGSTQQQRLCGFHITCSNKGASISSKLQMENKGRGVMDDKIVSPSMELLVRVWKHQVPLYLLCGNALKLGISSPSASLKSSRNFLQYLVDNKKVGYLVRLPLGKSLKSQPFHHGAEDGTKLWKNLVVENLNNMSQRDALPETSKMFGKVDAQNFLVCAEEGDCSTSCTAYLLQPCNNVDGAIGHEVAMMQLAGLPSNSNSCKEQVRDLCTSLPLFNPQALPQMKQHMESLQIKALGKWADEQNKQPEALEISVSSLLDILRTVRETYMATVMQKGLFQTSQEDQTPLQYKLLNPVPEYEFDVSTSMETMALQLWSQCLENRLGKTQSNESLAGMSPPAANGQVVNLNVSEFLKYFDASGSALKEYNHTLEPQATSKSHTRLYKANSGEAKEAVWPESCSYNYHDMYYNLDSETNLEKKCSRLKSCLQSIETTSTCVIEQVNSPATLMVPSPAPPPAVGEPEKKVSSRGLKRHASASMCAKDTGKLPLLNKRRSKPEVIKKKDTDADLSSSQVNKTEKETRSQRHARKLREIVQHTLIANGVGEGSPIYKPCIERLYQMSKSFVKDLTTSRNLKEEMKNIAELNVQSVIHFEQGRLKKRS